MAARADGGGETVVRGARKISEAMDVVFNNESLFSAPAPDDMLERVSGVSASWASSGVPRRAAKGVGRRWRLVRTRKGARDDGGAHAGKDRSGASSDGGEERRRRRAPIPRHEQSSE